MDQRRLDRASEQRLVDPLAQLWPQEIDVSGFAGDSAHYSRATAVAPSCLPPVLFAAEGNRISSVEPPPGTLLAVMAPPCDRMIPWTAASPRPRPRLLVE